MNSFNAPGASETLYPLLYHKMQLITDLYPEQFHGSLDLHVPKTLLYITFTLYILWLHMLFAAFYYAGNSFVCHLNPADTITGSDI